MPGGTARLAYHHFHEDRSSQGPPKVGIPQASDPSNVPRFGEERTWARLSRDLHDGALQSLVHLIEVAERPCRPTSGHALDDGELLRTLVEIADLARDIAFELRQVCEDLRPPMLDRLPLPLTLDSLINRYRATFGMHVTLVVTGYSEPPQGQLATLLYRVASEALSNAERHAQAEHAEVRLDLRPDSVSLVVADDGRGFAATKEDLPALTACGHLGLAGIFERVQEFDGTASVDRRAGGGTEVHIRVPYWRGETT
ncbi:sensor histidine kinase [Sinomonas terricola]|uniref:sensor histidine kinase n=1 Tax=Sinomonas terricola TaxID=3110330 RepID=UPI003D172DCC